MASCFFLLKQFEDVLIYLNSIKVKFTASHFCILILIAPLNNVVDCSLIVELLLQ